MKLSGKYGEHLGLQSAMFETHEKYSKQTFV
jgi:hypothetical protein